MPTTRKRRGGSSAAAAPAAEPAPAADVSRGTPTDEPAPAQPVSKFVIERADPVLARCGGHVLIEGRGWVLEQQHDQEQHDQEQEG